MAGHLAGAAEESGDYPGMLRRVADTLAARGEVLSVEREGSTALRVTFPTAPSQGDRILLEYPVNELLAWWVEQ